MKMTFLLASHQSTYVPENDSFVYRPYTSAENRNVVLFCNRDNWFVVHDMTYLVCRTYRVFFLSNQHVYFFFKLIINSFDQK